MKVINCVLKKKFLSDNLNTTLVRKLSLIHNLVFLLFAADTVFVVCFSLIMLSVDLCSPAIKNKMSKREFIRNTRRAVGEINDDFAGHLYDNIWLVGHVAPKA